MFSFRNSEIFVISIVIIKSNHSLIRAFKFNSLITQLFSEYQIVTLFNFLWLLWFSLKLSYCFLPRDLYSFKERSVKCLGNRADHEHISG